MRVQEFHQVGGIVVGGKLKLEGRKIFEDFLKRQPDGTKLVVTFEVEKMTRSLKQNAYWHAVVVPLFAEHCGYDFDEAKDALALELLATEIPDLRTGEVKVVPGHTSQLTVTEFKDLIERAQRLGASMDLYIPDPDEVLA